VSYTPHTPEEIALMLERVGASSIDELFEHVPASLRSKAEMKLAPALAERALLAHFQERAAANTSTRQAPSFIGAGAYDHFIPSVVGALASRGEFATAYTPYQAEISQGTLQAIFEFQTLICQLTGLEVANASLYDGASATAEAALMALRAARKPRLYVSAGLHPHYASVVRTYASDLDAELEVLPLGPDGRTAPAELADDCAGVVIQQPRPRKALLVSATAEPFALALLRSPGDCGVDIACGEAQGFGVPLSFGGPFVGFLATGQKLVRQLPGRLVGETVDSEERRAFVMTLTTREQHIRRERATSNICTNQGLMMLRATIFMSLLGKSGLRQVAESNLSLASYAKKRLTDAGLRLPYSAPSFNEFVVEVPDLSARYAHCIEGGLVPGLPLASLEPERENELLVCTTEITRRADIDRLARELTS